MRIKQSLLALLVAAALTACAIGPDYQRPMLDLPQGAAKVSVSANWWQQFGDATLDELIKQALQHNRDLQQAAARVDEAAAALASARASQLPQVNANLGGARAGTSRYSSGAGATGESYNAGLNASWEIDLWGKLSRGREAAGADLQAQQRLLEAARVSLSAQVSNSYFRMLSLDTQAAIASAIARNQDQQLEVMQKRFRHGMVSELELRQAEAEAAAARQIPPRLYQAARQAEHALAVLTGRSPKQIAEWLPRGGLLADLVVPPTVPADLPSDLMLRRPDIAAAEAQLMAANARIGVARSAYFPSISLTAALGSQSLELTDLFSGPARSWSFAGNLLAPIFNSGQIAAGVDAANARQKQALAAYEKAVQQAFADTLDALQAVQSTEFIARSQQEQLNAAREVQRLSKLRYGAGQIAFADLLLAERNLYQIELAQYDAHLARLNAVVALYAALGGGWASNGT